MSSVKALITSICNSFFPMLDVTSSPNCAATPFSSVTENDSTSSGLGRFASDSAMLTVYKPTTTVQQESVQYQCNIITCRVYALSYSFSGENMKFQSLSNRSNLDSTITISRSSPHLSQPHSSFTPGSEIVYYYQGYGVMPLPRLPVICVSRGIILQSQKHEGGGQMYLLDTRRNKKESTVIF